MLKRIDQILNICSGAFVGVFLGHWIYLYWHFRTHPELYAMNSAPWYVGLYIPGIVTAVLFALCLVGKLLVKRKLNQQENAKSAE